MKTLPTTFDGLPPNPYMAILLDPNRDEGQKVDEIRVLLDFLPESDHMSYLTFRSALVAKKATLESAIETIRTMPAQDIHQLLEDARDFSTPVRAAQLRESVQAFLEKADEAIAAFTQVQEAARLLERLFLLLSTAERGAEHETFGKVSGGSVSVSGSFNNFAYDLGQEMKQFNASLATFRQEAGELLQARGQRDRGEYVSTVTENLSRGTGQDVAAPPKAAFAARKKDQRPFTT